MKLFNSIVGIFAMGGLLVSAADPAKANACYPATAVDYAHLRRGGASHEFAWEKALFPIMMDRICQERVQSVLNLIGECGGKISWRRQIILS